MIDFPYFGGELNQEQLQELLRRADRTFRFQPPLSATDTGNEILVSLEADETKRCFVRAGEAQTPSEDCPNCLSMVECHPVFLDQDDNTIKVRCCETVNVYFPFMKVNELCSVQKIECPSPNDQVAPCSFTLDECTDSACGDRGCLIFCAEVRNGRWEADYRPNRLVCGTVAGSFSGGTCATVGEITIPQGGVACVDVDLPPEIIVPMRLTNVINCGSSLDKGDKVFAFQDICCQWQMIGIGSGGSGTCGTAVVQEDVVCCPTNNVAIVTASIDGSASPSVLLYLGSCIGEVKICAGDEVHWVECDGVKYITGGHEAELGFATVDHVTEGSIFLSNDPEDACRLVNNTHCFAPDPIAGEKILYRQSCTNAERVLLAAKGYQFLYKTLVEDNFCADDPFVNITDNEANVVYYSPKPYCRERVFSSASRALNPFGLSGCQNGQVLILHPPGQDDGIIIQSFSKPRIAKGSIQAIASTTATVLTDDGCNYTAGFDLSCIKKDDLKIGDEVLVWVDCTNTKIIYRCWEAEYQRLKACVCTLKDIVSSHLTLTPAEQTALNVCLCDGPCEYCETLPENITLQTSGATYDPVGNVLEITAFSLTEGSFKATVPGACVQSWINDIQNTGVDITNSLGACAWSGEKTLTCELNVELVAGTGEPGVTYPDPRTFEFRFTAQLNVDLAGEWLATIGLLEIVDVANPALDWSLLKNGSGDIKVFQLNTVGRQGCLTLTGALDDTLTENPEGLDLSGANMNLIY